MAAMPAARENMDTTMDDQLPPHKPQGQPHRQAGELKVPGSHSEAM